MAKFLWSIQWLLRFRRALILAMILCLAGCICVQVAISDSMASFTGEVQGVIIHEAQTDTSSHWNLDRPFLCVASSTIDKLPNVLAQQARQTGKSADCDNGLIAGNFLSIQLGGTVDISMDVPTDVSISLVGTGDTQALRISPANCNECRDEEQKTPTVHTELTGAEKFDLPFDAEIRVRNSGSTVLPYIGKIEIGNKVTDDTPSLLLSGKAAIFSASGTQLTLIKQTELFAGDIVTFRAPNGAQTASAGFIRVDGSEKGGVLDVVSSTERPGAAITVTRIVSVPGVTQSGTGTIAIKLDWLDGLFTHPLTGLLGALITLFVLVTELKILWADRDAGDELAPATQRNKALAAGHRPSVSTIMQGLGTKREVEVALFKAGYSVVEIASLLAIRPQRVRRTILMAGLPLSPGPPHL